MILNAYFQQITSKFIIKIFVKKWDLVFGHTHSHGVRGGRKDKRGSKDTSQSTNSKDLLLPCFGGVSSKIRHFFNMPFFNLIEIYVYYKCSCPNLIFWFLKF